MREPKCYHIGSGADDNSGGGSFCRNIQPARLLHPAMENIGKGLYGLLNTYKEHNQELNSGIAFEEQTEYAVHSLCARCGR